MLGWTCSEYTLQRQSAVKVDTSALGYVLERAEMFRKCCLISIKLKWLVKAGEAGMPGIWVDRSLTRFLSSW